VVQSVYCSLAAESVQTPEGKAIELTPRGRREHPVKLLTLTTLPAGAIHALVNHDPALGVCEGPEWY